MTVVIESKVVENRPPEARPISGSKLLAGAASLSASQVVRRAFRTLFLLLAARVLGPEIF